MFFTSLLAIKSDILDCQSIHVEKNVDKEYSDLLRIGKNDFI